MKKSDLLTGQSFVQKRITQKFACAQNRIKYHNQKANNLRQSIMSINAPLIKNLRILKDLMGNVEKKMFHKQFLLGKGYNFNVLTHYDLYNGEQVPCNYHFSFKINKFDMIMIIQLNLKKND